MDSGKSGGAKCAGTLIASAMALLELTADNQRAFSVTWSVQALTGLLSRGPLLFLGASST